MSQSRPPVTYGFTVSGNADNEEHSVGSIVVDKDTPLDEIRKLRDKQREALMKQGGGVSITTNIAPGANVKNINTAVNNITLTTEKKSDQNPDLNIVEQESSLTAKIPVKGHGDAIIVIEKTPGKKNAINIIPTVSNNWTTVTIHWDGVMNYQYVKQGTYHLNAGNFASSSWKTNEEIAAEQQRVVPSVSSSQAYSSASLSNASSTVTGKSSSQYSSSSSTVFKAESKQPNSTTANLPTVKELNDILGKSDLVEKVEEGYSARILITFNPEINLGTYEQILKEKLLIGISNASLARGDCPRLGIQKDSYEQFMKNIAANKRVAQLRT